MANMLLIVLSQHAVWLVAPTFWKIILLPHFNNIQEGGNGPWSLLTENA